MERYRRSKGKKALLGSHQKCWIWGRNLVLETLSAGRWPIAELYLADDLPAEEGRRARSLAAGAGVPFAVESPAALTRRCHASEHQGYLARMYEFPYADVEPLLTAAKNALFAIADGIQDPYNFGAIIRSAEVFGVHAVWIGEKGQVPVTSMVARSSAGAVNRVPIARVPNLAGLADRLRAAGVRVVGASEKSDRPLFEFDFTGPVAIVVGNEGRGIRMDLAARCDAILQIPQHGFIGSLNAAAAASVFFYEASRQRAIRKR